MRVDEWKLFPDFFYKRYDNALGSVTDQSLAPIREQAFKRFLDAFHMWKPHYSYKETLGYCEMELTAPNVNITTTVLLESLMNTARLVDGKMEFTGSVTWMKFAISHRPSNSDASKQAYGLIHSICDQLSYDLKENKNDQPNYLQYITDTRDS